MEKKTNVKKKQVIKKTSDKLAKVSLKPKPKPKPSTKTILSIEGMSVEFKSKRNYFEAVSNATFSLEKGEVLGLVGESGSGKSTIGRTLMGLNSFSNGSVRINDIKLPNNIDNITTEMRKNLSTTIQYIFQDPHAALNPNKTIKKSINEVFKNTYTYKKLLFEIYKKPFDKNFSKKEFAKLYEDLKLTNEQLINNDKSSKLKILETKINDEYFNDLKKVFTDYHKNNNHNIIKQKKKIITDNEYRANIKKIRGIFKDAKQTLKDKYTIELNNIKDLRKIKLVKDEYAHYTSALRNNAINLLAKNKLTVTNFKNFIKSSHVKKYDDELKNVVAKIIEEAKTIKPKSRDEYLQENLKNVSAKTSLNPEIYKKYPHELSGGQQQRAVLARALTVDPKIIIADEPVSALDVSIQSQVINSFRKISKQNGISILFIAHDLNIVRNISDRILVMYRGSIVEEGLTKDIFKKPTHPYTRILLESIPEITDYDIDKKLKFKFEIKDRKWFNLSPAHRIFATEKEISKWKRGVYE